ncbi:MAG TPA: flagellar filament capping protein FliD [Alkalispirochaeta sp.]|nr:flagellar filament capping protein FliD [Alkalispirochaeta sp.]
MSDISIPGISNSRGMDTSQMVDDLMEVERRPVRRLENRVETYETQQEVWRSIGRGLGALRDASRSMYGFENPFRERLANTSDPAILTATASRQAEEGIEELTVLQTAGRDRFASRAMPRDYRVPAGRYQFTVGEDSRSIRFGGGSLEDFSDEVNRRLQNTVRTSIIPDTRSTHVLVVESLQEGRDAPLSFGEDAQSLMEEIGIMEPARPDQRISLYQDETLRLEPGQEEARRLDEQFSIEPGMVLRFEARTEEIPRQEWTPPPVPPGPDVPDAGSVTLEGITIQNEALDLGLPQPEQPTEPEVIENNQAMAMIGPGDQAVNLPELPQNESFQMVEVPVADFLSRTSGFEFQNRNTNRILEIRNIQVFDPSQRGGSTPRNALDSARDARIRFNGIEITRGSNEIDDLIPGVTLDLRRPSTEPVEIEVQPDRESAKDAIIQMVGRYNQMIRDINIYTRNEQSLIDQIEYFDDAERETMRERLGIFQGDSSLNQLRQRMQTIMMNAYDTGPDGSYDLLAQIGISTNASGAAGNVDRSRLRGYLEINEGQLDEALNRDFAGVGSLFGTDSDGDLVVDRGVAVELQQFVNPYVQTGGIVAGRESSLDTQISQTQDRIGRYNDRLEDREQELRNEFGRMEGMMDQLEDSAQALDRLPSASQNNQ